MNLFRARKSDKRLEKIVNYPKINLHYIFSPTARQRQLRKDRTANERRKEEKEKKKIISTKKNMIMEEV